VPGPTGKTPIAGLRGAYFYGKGYGIRKEVEGADGRAVKRSGWRGRKRDG